MKIEIDRHWHQNAFVSKSWFKKGTLAKHRLYFYWQDKEFPCDEYGFRLPKNLENFESRYKKDKKKKIFCLGGSTTWGQFCNNEETYPSFLQNFFDDKISVYNFGGCDSDCRTQIYILIDLLRKNFLPDYVIFLDGINEKNGWLNKSRGLEYSEMNLHYNFFDFLMKKNSYLSQLKEAIQFRFKKKINGSLSLKKVNFDPMCFVKELSDSYLQSIQLVIKLSKTFKFQFYSFLQPVVYDIIDENPDRYLHIKGFYKNVIQNSTGNVFDISKNSNIKKENFLDWQHLDSDGNKALAGAIYDKLKNEI